MGNTNIIISDISETEAKTVKKAENILKAMNKAERDLKLAAEKISELESCSAHNGNLLSDAEKALLSDMLELLIGCSTTFTTCINFLIKYPDRQAAELEKKYEDNFATLGQTLVKVHIIENRLASAA